MKTSLTILACGLLWLPLLAGCDDKKPSGGAPSAAVPSSIPTVTASAPVTASSAAPTASSPAPSGSSATSMITGDAKEVVLTMKDPTKEPEKSVKAQAGGSLTVFLPDYPGTVWSIEGNDKTLGKAKEEVIPGFAPKTNGHQFKWTMNGPGLKTGQKFKVQFVNKKLGDKAAKPSESFALAIEIT